MPHTTLTFSVRDGIATITLNRPESYNTINRRLAQELAEVTLEAQDDRSVRVLVLRGAGRGFCAGGDLKEFASLGEPLSTYLHALTTDLHTAISRLARMPAPVIAAVHGSAAGGGMSLACACDLIIAAESARFTMAYTRVGLVPDASGSFFLPRIVGLRRAMDLILTNRVLPAREAMEWGLVNQVVPDDSLSDRVTQVAADLAAGPAGAHAAAKRLVLGGLTESLETQMAEETRTLAQIAQTDNTSEGLRAFLEKRPPRFQ